MKRLTIDRSRWARGPTMEEGTYLLDPSGDTVKQCCVGIYLSSLGVEDETLAWVETADRATGPLPDEANWLLHPAASHTWASEIAKKLYGENDRDQSEEDRERKIAALFARKDIEVEFIG